MKTFIVQIINSVFLVFYNKMYYPSKNVLSSKTLGTNELELQFVICWQTMIKT